MKRLLIFLLFAIPASGQNVPYSDITLSSRGTPVGGAPIGVCGNPGLSTTAAQVISNIAVLTMSSNPITAGFVANQAIAVSGFTGADTYFNGGTVTSTGITNNFLILSVTSTQITYSLVHANASATTNGSVFQAGSQAQACAPLSSIFNDAAGASPITQPGLTSTGLGNYQFYAAPNSYYVQFFGATIGELLKPIVLPPSTVNGTTSFTAITSNSINNTPATCPQTGATLGARILAAYASTTFSGVIDASCETGPQTISVDVFSSFTTPVKLIFGKNIGIISVSNLQHILTNNIKIEGPATNDNLGGVPQAPQSAGLRFRYTGSAAPTSGVFNIGNSSTSTMGVDLSYVHIDCNSLAGYGIIADRAQEMTWTGVVSAENCTNEGMRFLSDIAAGPGGTINNNIGMLGSFNSPSCFSFEGNANANVAASRINYLRCSYASAATTSNISSSPTGATESGNTVTITATANCSFTTGQRVLIAGVGVAGYNGSFIVLSPGCNGGATFTYTNPVSGLGTSGSGTATFSTSGIDMFQPDSLTIGHAYVFRASGTGCGVYFHFNSGNNWNARGTLLEYLDPNQGGVCTDSGSSSANKISYLFLENWIATNGNNTCTGAVTATPLNEVCGGGIFEWTDNNGLHTNTASTPGFGAFSSQVPTPAIASANQASPNQLGACGNFWTGSASNQACHTTNVTFSSGANPLGQVTYDLLAYSGSGQPGTYPGFALVHGFHGSVIPTVAGASNLGSGGNPWGGLFLGTAGTNNFAFTPAATAAVRTVSMPDPGTNVNLAFVLTATSAAFATATTAGTCVQNTTAVAGAATTMAVSVSPVSTPGVGAVWSAFVSSAGNVTINECAVATSAGGSIAFNIRVTP